MIRINYLRQAIYFFVFVIVQIPMLYEAVIFDVGFAFFYVGFLVILPYGLNRSVAMLVAFVTGLLIDVFSNTPGIHASACLVIAFAKDFWYLISIGDPEDDTVIDWNSLNLWGFMRYAFPLFFIHHTMVFVIENGGLYLFSTLMSKIVYSSGFGFVLFCCISYLLTPNTRRQ